MQHTSLFHDLNLNTLYIRFDDGTKIEYNYSHRHRKRNGYKLKTLHTVPYIA